MATLGELTVRLMADMKQFVSGFDTATGKMKSFSLETGDTMSAVKELAGPLAGLASVAAIGQGLRASTQAFADFEATMVRVGGISRTLGSESFAELSQEARNMAASTEFSASQVGESMRFLAASGMDANGVLASTPAVLELASAAMLDVARAADITTNVATGFGLELSKLSQANDTLFATTTNSNTTIEQLGQAFKFVGPVAKSAGQTFEDTAAAIGVLGNAGIQGEMAGTALRGIMTKLLAPSKAAGKLIKQLGIDVVDSTGKMKPFREVIKQVGESGATTGQLMQIFGQRAGPAMAALVGQGTDAIDKLADAIDTGAGGAAKQAEANINTLQGQMKILDSVVEELKISFGQGLAPVLKDIIIPTFQALAFSASKVAQAIGFANEQVKSGTERAADRVKGLSDMIRDAEQNIRFIETMGQTSQGRTVAGDEAEKTIANLRKSIARWKKDIMGANAQLSTSAKTIKQVEDGTANVASNTDEAAKAAEKFRKSMERALAGFENKTIKMELEAGSEGAAQSGARKLIAEFEKLVDGAQRAFKGAPDRLADELDNLGMNAASQAELLLDSAETWRDFDRALRELSDAGILTAERMKELRDAIDPAKFKTAQSKRTDTDAGAAFAAMGKDGFAAIKKAGLEATADAAAAEAAFAREAADQQIATQRDLIARQDDLWTQGFGMIFGDIAGFVIGKFGEIANAVGQAFENAFSSVMEVLTSNQRVAGLAQAAQPVVAAFSAIASIAGVAAGIFAALSFVPILGQGIQAATIVAFALTAVIGGLAAAIAALVGVIAGFVAAFVAGLMAPLIPIFTALAGFAFAVTNAAAAIAVLPATMAALTSAFAFLVMQTESFAEFSDAMGQALQPLVDAAEPFAQNLLFLAGVVEILAEAFAPLVERVASSEALMRVFLFAVQLAASAFLDFVGVSFFLIDMFGAIGQAMLGVFNAMQGFFTSLVELIPEDIRETMGLEEFGRDIRSAGRAATDASNALGDIRPSAEDRDRLADAKATLWATTLGDLTAAGEELVPPVEDAADGFTELSEATAGTVEGFNFERLRFEAAGGQLPAGDGGIPGLPGEDDATGRPVFNFPGTIIIQANNIDEFVEQLEVRQRQGQFNATGSINPRSKLIAGRSVG